MGFYDNAQNDDFAELRKYDDAYDAAKIEAPGGESIPDGNYQVEVDRVELTRAKKTGNPMLKWGLRVINSPFKGRLLWRNNVMASPDNIKWLKQDLYTCGIVLPKLSDLPDHLKELLDVKLEITKRTKGENENIYFNRRIILNDAPATPALGEDVPF